MEQPPTLETLPTDLQVEILREGINRNNQEMRNIYRRGTERAERRIIELQSSINRAHALLMSGNPDVNIDAQNRLIDDFTNEIIQRQNDVSLFSTLLAQETMRNTIIARNISKAFRHLEI